MCLLKKRVTRNKIFFKRAAVLSHDVTVCKFYKCIIADSYNNDSDICRICKTLADTGNFTYIPN